MDTRCFVLALGFSSALWCAESGTCRPTPEVRLALDHAAAVVVTTPFAAFERAAPFKAVRDRFPGDLFAHEAYQDAMQEYGIEGHLRYLVKEYEDLQTRHPGNAMYEYLAWRALVGRTTPEAIEGLERLLAAHPGFAAAHRTLAGIYGVERFRDTEKENAERERFLALCPAGVFTRRRPSIPQPSPLIDEAESMMRRGVDPLHVIETAMQGQREYEWRSQRIRVFDWYTEEFKKKDAQYLRGKNWQAWVIRARCYWKLQRPLDASSVLIQMRRTLPLLRAESEAAYWNGLDTLARLYIEGNQNAQAAILIEEMRQLAVRNPAPERFTHLQALEKIASAQPQALSLEPAPRNR
jgi:hypothetical protein